VSEFRSIYLPGDSFPDDEHVRRALQQRLGIDLRLVEHAKPEPPDIRFPQFQAYMDANPDAIFVLFGRSSGCRTVTQLAADPRYAARIAAVVALSYPFRRPGWPHEPERFMHLHQVLSRCLIVQGTADDYSDGAEPHAYWLSPSTSVCQVRGDHGMWFDAAEWDRLAGTIRDFLGERLMDRLRPADRRLVA